MSYFGNGFITGSQTIDVPVYEGYVEPTTSALMDIAMEGLREDFQIAAAMEIADAQLTLTAVTESVGQADIVLESIVGSTITKIKESLKKLWAKVKAWFKSVRERLGLLFSKGKKFLEKYREQIKNKPTTGFTYTGTVWTMSAGAKAVEDAIKALSGIVDKRSASLAANVEEIVTAGKASSASTEAGEDSLDELKDEIYGDVATKLGFTGGNADSTDITKAAKEAFRGGKSDSETEEIKGFDKISKDDLMEIIEKNEDILRAVKNAESAADRMFSSNLDRIKRAETHVSSIKEDDERWTKENISGPDHTPPTPPTGGSGDAGTTSTATASAPVLSGAQTKARVTNYISRISTATKLASAINSTLSTAASEAAASAAKEAESVLKRFINYRGAKESASYDGGNYADPVIENLMNMTGI